MKTSKVTSFDKQKTMKIFDLGTLNTYRDQSRSQDFFMSNKTNCPIFKQNKAEPLLTMIIAGLYDRLEVNLTRDL